MSTDPEKFGGWLSLQEVFTRVNRELGDKPYLACHDMKQPSSMGRSRR